ncbi:MAG TPA: hypothetical protein VGO50_02030 [Pyrinomonadaceae bacterium]|nr:hypothetical protein [Pyrinomonadaceae bacterium]
MNLPIFRSWIISGLVLMFSIWAPQSIAQTAPAPFPQNLVQCNLENDLQRRLYYEYGAVYLSEHAKLPRSCRFLNETEIAEFTNQFKNPGNKFSFGEYYLQHDAYVSLTRVIQKLDNKFERVARNSNGSTTVTSGINDDWAVRTYAQTQVNWLRLLIDRGFSKNNGILTISIDKLIGENSGVTGKPLMFSAAIPGGSQHHLGLAIDVNDPGGNATEDNKCRKECEDALRENHWYRTVRYDAYHFTYLGIPADELESKGLKRVICANVLYWVPNSPSDYKGYPGWNCRKPRPNELNELY